MDAAESRTEQAAAPIGLGVIGGGGAFGRFIASALPLVPGVEIRAIAGSNPERTHRAAADLGVPFWTVRYEELVARPEVDLVIVASPPHLHAAMALAALGQGKAVFVEKPLATTLDDGLAVLAAARRRGVPAGIDYVMRYSPLYGAAEQIVRGGMLGDLRRVDFRNDAGDEGLAADHWFWDRARSGGIFIEHGVHFFDVYGSLIGADPIHVHGVALTRQDTEQQDVVHADVQYRNGVLASYTHAFDKPSRLESQEGLLVFDRGFVRISGWTPVRLELTGVVSELERAALAAITGMRMDTVEAFSEANQQMRGRGRQHEVHQRVRGVLAPPDGSQELYRRAVAAAMGDLVAAMRDPNHQPRVTLADGVVSLAIATVAAGTASNDDLRRAISTARAYGRGGARAYGRAGV